MNFKAKAIRFTAAAGLALVMTTGVAFASIGSGTVTADSLRLRSEASTNSSTVTKAPKGATVTVEEDMGNGWYKVTYGNKTGYMSGDWLTVSLNDGTVLPAAEGTAPQQKRGLITADVLNVRSGAGTGYEKVASLKAGTVVDIVADWATAGTRLSPAIYPPSTSPWWVPTIRPPARWVLPPPPWPRACWAAATAPVPPAPAPSTAPA